MIEILVPAAFAGLTAIAVTLAIERWGGTVGGLIATLPSTIVPSAVGFWWSSPDAFLDAMAIAPAGMVVNALFLLVWRVLPDRLPNTSLRLQLSSMVAASLGVWALAAGTLTLVVQAGFRPLTLGWVGLILQLVLGVAATWTAVPAPKGKHAVTLPHLLARGVLAGGAILVALLIAKTGAGVLAGMASVFPAIFLTSMVGVWVAQGRGVSGGAVGPMVLGSASVSGFALAARWMVPDWGLTSLPIAWVIAVLGLTVPARLWLSSREPRRHGLD